MGGVACLRPRPSVHSQCLVEEELAYVSYEFKLSSFIYLFIYSAGDMQTQMQQVLEMFFVFFIY